jgi:two-component system, sensor histidine kinase LadS
MMKFLLLGLLAFCPLLVRSVLAVDGQDRASDGAAAPPVILDDRQGEYPLGLHLELLADPDMQWTIEDVSAPPLADRFVPSRQENLQLGGFIPSLWVRFTAHNTTESKEWVLISNLLGYEGGIDLFVPNVSIGSPHSWTTKRTEGRIAFKDREFQHRYPGFRLAIEPGEARTFYLRIGPVANLSLVLWSQEAFAEQDHDAQMVLGAYYGIILVMALYNLFIFISLRDRSYLYYVVMVTFLGFWFTHWNGLFTEYLWPEGRWSWTQLHTLIFGLGSASIFKFVQSFLMTRVHLPRIHHLISVMIALHVLIIVAPFFELHILFLSIQHLFELTKWSLVLAAGILTWRRGFRPARFFVLAWTAFVCGGFMINLAFMGVLPFNFITLNGFQIAHALEVVLLSLALADRINLLRTEKEAQEAELQTAHHLQMGLMPTQPPELENYDLAGRCLPASQVGGDFFQYFQADGRLSLCLADVTGHAMEAAVPVMMFSGVLETEMQYGHPVGQLLTRLNRLLHRKLDSRTFICFAIGEVHLESRRLRLANVGCPPLYHYRQATRQVTELEGGGYPLGVQPEGRYAATEIALAPGDRIVLCSDGLVEAANGQEEIFGFEQIAEAIRQGCAEDLSAADLIDRLFTEVQAFAGDVPQGDDMTCVVLTVKTQD